MSTKHGMNADIQVSAPRSAKRDLAADLLLWLISASFGFALVFLVNSRLRALGAGPQWLVQTLQPLVTLPVLTAVLRWRGESWNSLGLRRPDWPRFLCQVLVGFVVMVTAGYLIRHIVIAPLHLHSSTRTALLRGLQNDTGGLAKLLILVVFVVGFNEELQFRGFVQSRFSKVFVGPAGRYAAVVITAMLFGVAHLAWGPAPMVYTGLLGILLGVIYLWADGNLWVPVVLHSIFDVTRAVEWFLTGSDIPM